MPRIIRARQYSVGILGVLILSVLAISGFAAGRRIGKDHPPAPVAQASENQPPVGNTLSTAETDWQAYAASLEQADQTKPRYAQTNNGITIGPQVREDDGRCTSGAGRYIDVEATKSTDIDIVPRWLPRGSTVREDTALACGDLLRGRSIEYGLPADDQVGPRMRAGEEWFDVNHGGHFSIWRKITSNPALSTYIASELCRPEIVTSLPAVVCSPLDARGFGNGLVVTWDAASGVFTVVKGTHLSEASLLAIAEGLE